MTSFDCYYHNPSGFRFLVQIGTFVFNPRWGEKILMPYFLELSTHIVISAHPLDKNIKQVPPSNKHPSPPPTIYMLLLLLYRKLCV